MEIQEVAVGGGWVGVGGSRDEEGVGVNGGSDEGGLVVGVEVGRRWRFGGNGWVVAGKRDGRVRRGILDWREARVGVADGVDERLGLGVVVLGWPDCGC